jgi:hypothetical protein
LQIKRAAMKKVQNTKSIALIMLITGLLTFILSFNVEAQDSLKTKGQKGVVVLKIQKDDNGKTTVIDTTFTITTPDGQEELEKYLKKHEAELKNLDEELDYDFDIPCSPDIPSPHFPGFEGFEGEFMPGCDMRVFRYDNKRQTLSDIIGDIPMDRVKSYSIKDRKNGKRITIDIEDVPLFEKQDKVIVIREPGRPPHKKDQSERQMKVIIKSDDDTQIKK